MKKDKPRLTFGLLVDWISACDEFAYYQTNIIEGVEDFARKNDINLICFVTGGFVTVNAWEKGRNAFFDFIDKELIDGLIVLGAAIEVNIDKDRVLGLLNKYKGIPVVTINSSFDGYPYVCTNNYKGMRQILEHLIEHHGYRKIAFIKGAEGNYDGEMRFKAYIDSLNDNNIPFDENLVYQGNFLYEAGREAVKCFLDERNVSFDAVVAANDDMAIGASNEINERADKLPNFIAVTGFDNSLGSRNLSLTTVHQSFYEQAQIAASMLLNFIRGKRINPKEKVDAELVIRASCGCPPANVKKVMDSACSLSEEPFEDALQALKPNIMSELSVHIRPANCAYENELYDWADKLVDALCREVCAQQVWAQPVCAQPACVQPQQKFLIVWNSTLLWAAAKRIDFDMLQELLTLIRSNVLSCVSKQSQLVRLENLFYSGQVVLYKIKEKQDNDIRYQDNIRFANFNCLGEHIISTHNYKHQLELLKTLIPEYGVKECYISLYEDCRDPVKYSRLILACSTKHDFDVDSDGIRFHTPNLLPESIMKVLEKERFSYVVQALFLRDSQFGFALINNSKERLSVIEIIRSRLGVALNNSLLHEKVQKKAELESRLKDQEMQNLIMKNHLKEAELQALQAQINPHLILNTLNAGAKLAALEGAEKTGLFLGNLANLFRYNLKKLEKPITLGEEIENIITYMEILKVRSEGNIEFYREIEDGVSHVQMPCLILQPIVENAFIHGIGDMGDGGRILLKVGKIDDRVEVTIEDNGKGMDKQKVTQILEGKEEHEATPTLSGSGQGTGIGMSNIINRLRLFFDCEDVINIESAPGEGTKVSIRLPQ